MPTSATGPIRRPGQRSADRFPTSAIVDNITSELALAPAMTHSGSPRGPAVPASTKTKKSPNPNADASAIASTRPDLPAPPAAPVACPAPAPPVGPAAAVGRGAGTPTAVAAETPEP